MSTASKTTTAKPKKSSASKKAPAPVPAKSAAPAPAQPKPQSSYFNLHIDGLGYLSNIREINTATGSFLSCTINALHGSTEKPEYTRFDVTVSGWGITHHHPVTPTGLLVPASSIPSRPTFLSGFKPRGPIGSLPACCCRRSASAVIPGVTVCLRHSYCR